MPEEASDRVGTSILFENDRIRVWEMTLDIGEGSGFHQHMNDYVFVYVTPSEIDFREPGKKPVRLSCDDGFVQYNVVGRAGMAHEIANAGSMKHRQIIVELLGESVADESQPAERNDRMQ